MKEYQAKTYATSIRYILATKGQVLGDSIGCYCDADDEADGCTLGKEFDDLIDSIMTIIDKMEMENGNQ